MQLDQVAGIITRALGMSPGATRIDKQSAAVVADGRCRYAEMVQQGQVFSLSLTAITTGVAAGNLVGAAAAASTQFGIINPQNSGYNLELLKFGMGVVSGTPGAGPLFHGFITNISSLTAASAGGTVRSNICGVTGGSITTPWALAAGSALTGSSVAPLTIRAADFACTGTAQANVTGHLRVIENIDGEIIIPPNCMWLPLWSAAGTSLLCGYSITWAEVPV